MKYNEKKRLQIAMRRQFSSPANGKEISILLGIDKQGFINHVNRFLLEGMTVENFGKVWSLDHIVPVELFDLSNIDEKRLCYNYLNIMPMFNNDNRMKGASIHFSLQKLESLKHVPEYCSGTIPVLEQTESTTTMYTNVYVLDSLILKCNEELIRTYQKYLLPL
jgi:hypothetical protein